MNPKLVQQNFVLFKSQMIARTASYASRMPSISFCAVVAFTVVALSACAVQQGRNGVPVLGIDDAELFGSRVQNFKLPNGQIGALRVLNGVYSLKFDTYAQVVIVGRATSARILKTGQIGDRSTVLIEKSEINCLFKYQLVSVHGSDVLSWDLGGDCQTRPSVSYAGGGQQIDFEKGARLIRYVHRDTRLLRTELANSAYFPPKTPIATPPIDTRRIATETTPRSRSGSAPTAPHMPSRPRDSLPPGPPKLDFPPSQDEKPVRIILDK